MRLSVCTGAQGKTTSGKQTRASPRKQKEGTQKKRSTLTPKQPKQSQRTRQPTNPRVEESPQNRRRSRTPNDKKPGWRNEGQGKGGAAEGVASLLIHIGEGAQAMGEALPPWTRARLRGRITPARKRVFQRLPPCCCHTSHLGERLVLLLQLRAAGATKARRPASLARWFHSRTVRIETHCLLSSPSCACMISGAYFYKKAASLPHSSYRCCFNVGIGHLRPSR